jgi:phage gpG-like protein
MSIETITAALKAVESSFKKAAIAAVEVEVGLSIRKNFEAGGRPVWTPRKSISKKQKGTNILVVSGNMSNVTATAGENSVIISANPNARAYSKIQNDGGVINMPAHTVRHRKVAAGKNKGRTVFASSKHKKATETQTKAYKITIPARPFMVIPPEDYAKIVERIKNDFKL